MKYIDSSIFQLTYILNCRVFALYFFLPYLLVYGNSLQSILPFCMREVWVVTACLALIRATSSNYKDGLVSSEVEKEFYRLQGDLYSLCRIKVRLLYVLFFINVTNAD